MARATREPRPLIQKVPTKTRATAFRRAPGAVFVARARAMGINNSHPRGDAALIDGKAIAAAIREEIKAEVDALTKAHDGRARLD